MVPTVQTADATRPRAHSAGGAPEPAPIIRLIDVHKSFGPQRVLEGLNLDIRPRETTVILGPSGCGKSVMLKHIVGLLHPEAGEIHFDGRRIDTLGERDLRDVRLQIGLLFQMGALFDSMTVAENIAFPMIEHTSLNREERKAKIVAALETVDLHGMQNKLPSQLSGGQRKRVALARAIVLNPRVVLYDEPTTGLDPIRADGINELVIKLKRTMGVTSLVVTHDLVSAQKVADRVVMLLSGKIAADGRYQDLENHPDPQVRHFVAGQYDRQDDDAMPEPSADGTPKAEESSQ